MVPETQCRGKRGPRQRIEAAKLLKRGFLLSKSWIFHFHNDGVHGWPEEKLSEQLAFSQATAVVYARSFVNAVNRMPVPDVTDMPLNPALLHDEGPFVLNVGHFHMLFWVGARIT